MSAVTMHPRVDCEKVRPLRPGSSDGVDARSPISQETMEDGSDLVPKQRANATTLRGLGNYTTMGQLS
ncbi:hypothetical protein WN943_003377 [Citrus x changshan-huyou]